MAVGGGVPTINLRIDYLRPAVGSVLTGTARVRRAGRTVALVDVDVYDEQRVLVAVGRGTYSGRTSDHGPLYPEPPNHTPPLNAKNCPSYRKRLAPTAGA